MQHDDIMNFLKMTVGLFYPVVGWRPVQGEDELQHLQP